MNCVMDYYTVIPRMHVLSEIIMDGMAIIEEIRDYQGGPISFVF